MTKILLSCSVVILINNIDTAYRFHQIVVCFINKLKLFMGKADRIIRDDIC